MRKLERMLRKEVRKFPGWKFLGPVKRQTHYVITKGKKRIFCASTPKNNTTVIKNLRQEIRRIESGQWT